MQDSDDSKIADKDTNILRAFIDPKTVLAVLAFAALTALVFVLRRL